MGTLEAAIGHVEQACRLLETGNVLEVDGCAGRLESALDDLHLWRESRAEHRPDGPARLRTLSRGLGRARRLLDNAAAFYEGWNARHATIATGYGATGSPAVPAADPCASLSLEG